MAVVGIETQIDIVAPPEAVWRVLTDFASYHRWNPFMDRIDGVAEVGQRLTVHMTSAHGRGMTFKPVVTAVTPARELRWLGRLVFGGLFDGEHYFVLTPLVERVGTRLVHGEKFSGVLVAAMKRTTSSTHDSFDAFNVALRDRVEQLPATAGA